jgi:hypothetical protein
MTVGDEVSLPGAMNVGGLQAGPCEAMLEADARRPDEVARRCVRPPAPRRRPTGTGSESMALRVGDKGDEDGNNESELRQT